MKRKCNPSCDTDDIVEELNEETTGICLECKEHCSIIEYSCECGANSGKISDCCGNALKGNE